MLAIVRYLAVVSWSLGISLPPQIPQAAVDRVCINDRRRPLEQIYLRYIDCTSKVFLEIIAKCLIRVVECVQGKPDL
jgi:hypothetical protein